MALGRAVWRTRPTEDVAPEEAPAEGAGRRRAALLRDGAEHQRETRLDRSDLELLMNDRSPTARAGVARKFGRQFGTLVRGKEAEIATALLQLLVSDVTREVRAALAEAVAQAPELPLGVARRLAVDEIEVARPVLAMSPVLSDTDLVHVVRTHAIQYALAIAGRNQISTTVTQALSETGSEEVVIRVLENEGAKLSSKTIEQIMDDYGASRQVRDRLVRRPQLPLDLVERIVGAVGQALEWELVSDRRMSIEEAQVLMQRVREQATLDVAQRQSSGLAEEQRFRERFSAGEVDHEALLIALRDGDIFTFERGLALHANIDLERLRRLIYHPDRRHLAAVCVRAGLGTTHYIIMRMAIEVAETTLAPQPGAATFSGESLRNLQERYEKLRENRTLLDQLLLE